MVFSSWHQRKEKKFKETHWNIFGVFDFLEQANKREKQKREKVFTQESSQQAKEEREIFIGFVFNTTTTSMGSKLARNYN